MTTAGQLRRVRCTMVVLNVFPQIMQDLMKFSMIPAKTLYDKILRSKAFLNRLTAEEITTIQTLMSNHYTSLDVTLIYKIMKYFKIFIPPPARKWGSNPLPDELGIGDDVERIRLARHKCVTYWNTEISEKETTDFYETFIAAGKRIDQFLDNQKESQKYEKAIRNYRTLNLGKEIVKHTILAVKEIESMRDIQLTMHVAEKEIQIHTGTNMEDIVRVFQNTNAESTTAVQVIIHGVNDPEVTVELINGLGSMVINTEDIYFKEALVEVSEIPDVITKMDNRSIEIYKNMLKTGSEKKRDIRLILVGKKGSGKTSLVRNLLRQDLSNVTETNGIEIHVKKCKIRCKDGMWDSTYDSSRSCDSRLKRTFVDFATDESKNPGSVTESDEDTMLLGDGAELNRKSTDFDTGSSNLQRSSSKTGDYNQLQEDQTEHLDNQIITEPTSSMPCEDLHQQEDKQNEAGSYNVANSEKQIENNIEKILRARDITEEFANVYIWDFAGDEEFYNTHQIFFAREVIYLVLTNLIDDCKEKTGAFRFWFDSIHSLCDEISNADNDLFNPPIIVVGTHTDMLEGNETKCEERLKAVYSNILPKLRNHIRGYTLLSNTKEPFEKIDGLRQQIFETAKKARNWDIILPVKFILLEEKLEGHKVGQIPILQFSEIERLALETDQPITQMEELDLFLRYHHEIGNLIYFADLPEYVILDAQWLADIFKSVVTADQFQLTYPGVDWEEVKNTGKLSKQLLDKLLSQHTTSEEQQRFLLHVLEKFDILVRPHILSRDNTVTECEDYYVPCMVKAVPSGEIDRVLKGLKPKSKSVIFCLDFQFLPPTAFNRLLVSCCRHTDFTSAHMKHNGNQQLAFYRDMAIFDVSHDGCVKLILARHDNIIQLQVFNFGTKQTSLINIREFIIGEVNEISKQRFEAKQLTFKTKMKCPESNFDSSQNMREYTKDMHIEEYFCDVHDEVHTLKDDWFECQSPYFRDTSKLKKKKSKGMWNNRDNEFLIATRKGKILKQLSPEQLNFVRMGMISLDIFGDVLYNLLKLDTSPVPQRSTCDVTLLYQKHRSLNKHLPSTKRWGGGPHVENVMKHHKAIGDDIERIRLIRNEIAHSKEYSLPSLRFSEMYLITMDILYRFDLHIKPSESYLKRLEEIKQMTYTNTELAQVQEKLTQDIQVNNYYYGDNMTIQHIY